MTQTITFLAISPCLPQVHEVTRWEGSRRVYFVSKYKYYMTWAVINTVPATTEPVTTAELAEALRLNWTDENTLLRDYIVAARILFETYTQRVVATSTFKLVLDMWPPVIYLPRAPIQSITNVQYVDVAGNLQTFSPPTGAWDTYREPARLRMQYVVGSSIPSLSLTVRPSVLVTFVAGYTTVPTDIKLAIKLLACHFYGNREAMTTENYNDTPFGFRAICDLYKLNVKGDWGMAWDDTVQWGRR